MATISRDYLSPLIEKIREDNLLLPGEEFMLEDTDEEKLGPYFIEDGTIFDEGHSEMNALQLENFLYGYARIVKKRYKPKLDDYYYTINICGNIPSIFQSKWEDTIIDYERFYLGLCFKTEYEAKTMEKPYLRKLKEFYDEIYN